MLYVQMVLNDVQQTGLGIDQVKSKLPQKTIEEEISSVDNENLRLQ